MNTRRSRPVSQRARLWWIAPVLLLIAPWAANAQELTVSAASSLQNALREIGAAFVQVRPGAKLNFNFAASGPLLAQITQGAPVDVFASADTDTMDKAQARDLLHPGTRVNFTGNELVLVTPRSPSAPAINTLADLRHAAVQRIAIGNPATVPAGHYAQAALAAQSLWEPLSHKFVFAENVRQSLNYVNRAEAQAGFVYRTDALIDAEKVRIAFAVPTATPVRYPAAVVKTSKEPQAAGDFVKFLQGPTAQAILNRHGFTAPAVP